MEVIFHFLGGVSWKDQPLSSLSDGEEEEEK
jgi:hypothetical protein